MPEKTLQKSYFLSVSECKRLIARGVAAHPLIEETREEGVIAVAKGTTNAYVVEELTGMQIERRHYCTGTSQPTGRRGKAEIANKLHDLILRNGTREEGPQATEVINEMGPGDIFIKGANALNYAERTAGLLIGHPEGGTVGAAIGRIIARRITLMIPIGLEKCVPTSIREMAMQLNLARKGGKGPTLWPLQGEIVTELDAVRLLTGALAVPIAAGGVNGGEGGLWLSVSGKKAQLDEAEEVIGDILGEPPFVE